MKLIRIASNNQLTGFFNNEFSEAITLPPHSKVALLNGVFAMDSKSIFVPTESTITFQPKATAVEETATLPAGFYTRTTLLSTLQQVMNYALPKASMGNVCFAWSATLTSNQMSLNFARTDQVAFPATNLTKMTGDAGTFTTTAASTTPGQFKSFGYSDVTVLPYNTTLSCKNNDGAGGEQNDNVRLLYGLLKTKPQAGTTFLRIEDFMYGIHYDGTDGYYIADGAVTGNATDMKPSTVGVTITFDRSTVRFNDETDYTITEPFSTDGYHLAFALYGNAAKITDTLQNPNPFDTQTAVNGVVIKTPTPFNQVLHVDESLGLGAVNPTKVTLTMNEPMEAVLGYYDDPSPMSAISGSYISDQSLVESNTPTSITVELPNLGGAIDSLDGISEKRRPIVAVVPSMVTANGMLKYEPPFPPFIDLNNRFPIQLSRLEIRLLSSFDDSQVNLETPGCSLCFLLDHKSSQTSTK